MNRNEAMLRELNLYPQWERKKSAVPTDEQQAPVLVGQSVSGAIVIERKIEKREAEPVGVHQAANEVKSELHENPGKFQIIAPASELGSLSWPQLRQRVHDCAACKLRTGCMQTVFGVGDEKADWLFVGEGPGAEEDARGEPFVGEAGKLLDNMLMAIKLQRGKNVYIANIVKCRPPNNRAPEANEVDACLPYLQRQIVLIQPRLIVALGKVASNALLGRNATLGSLRGTLHHYHGIPLVVTYHPAYLLRSPSEKNKAWQDLCLAVEKMGWEK